MKPLPRIEGEVQRYQIGPDGDEWVKADDYAALNDYAALVQMERDMARAEVERLRALIKRARPYVQAYAAITRTDEVSLDASETAEAMRLSGPTPAALVGRMDLKRFEKAPCYICGYNGPNYYQAEVHECAGRYHEQTNELP